MAGTKRFCIDRILPRDLRRPQRMLRPGVVRGILVKNSMWPNGSTLTIGFVGGTMQQQARVKEAAEQWTRHANLKFEFVDRPNAPIRVGFDENDGSWSYVGTDALEFPDAQTVNFGWLDEGVVLHEFGHAIGMGHEHQNPAGGLQWNEQAVIRDLGGPPNNWPPEVTRHNVIEKYSADQVNGTTFDPDSIMLYAFPASWTVNGVATHANERLSDTDKQFIASAAAYPRTAPQDDLVVNLEVGGPARAASIGKPGEEDLFCFRVTDAGGHSVWTEGPTDVVMRLYGPDDRTRLVDEDDDSGKALNARITRALQPGEYLVQVRHYNLSSGTGDYSVQVKKR
ncbi:MAG: peptidase [Acidobacteria bacterium]|nr:peptidase [Acidobacteriota bacterium]